MCVWTPNADTIQFTDDVLSIVFVNNRVNRFLHDMKQLGIAGIKGQGKTFLLKAKRMYIGEHHDGALLLPKNTMMDALDSSLRIDSRMKRFLSSYTNWVAIWKISLAISILQSEETRSEIDSRDFESMSIHTRDLFAVKNDQCRPSIILYRLLGLNQKAINIILRDTAQVLQMLSYVQSPVCVFIDKVDQAFASDIYEIIGDDKSTIGSRNSSIWQYCQYALANAAYDVYMNNQHIKVYYSIRQEALVDVDRIAMNTARNINGFLTSLEYSKSDLKEMFMMYIQKEDEKNLNDPIQRNNNPEASFLGFDHLAHGYVNQRESIFDYIYRHTVMRPYDIMKICYELYLYGVREIDEAIVKHIVNSTAQEIVKNYLSEIEPFSFKDNRIITELLQGLGTNAFDSELMKYACRRYMLSMGKHDTCKMNCEICQDLYPFSNLYNIGLLGILYKNESNVDFEQRFLPIGKRITNANHIQLPQSDLFFLHPCLSDIAREKRKNNRRFYENTRHTIVGNTISCSTGAMERISADLKRWTDVWQGEKVFISSTVDDLTEERDALKSSLAKKGYYPVLSESPDFQYGGSQVFSHDHCIDEILKCKNMVLIIGKRYGGEYRGEKYKEYAEKIVELSGGKISAPSITLMEYFMARTKRLRYCVFIDNDVILYKNREGIGSAVKSRIGMQGTKDMDKAVEVFNFVNHAKISNSPTALGNWLFPYKSIEDIETVISNFSFEIMEA